MGALSVQCSSANPTAATATIELFVKQIGTAWVMSQGAGGSKFEP